jgi:uncharacterized Zn finger protein (UPF0148 family)
MSPNNVCPSCGAALEENVGSACPFCGSALSLSTSAPTIISVPKKKKASAQSSAEAMDEVKKLVSEGDSAAAAEFASVEFGLDQDAAERTVEQVSFDLKRSGRKPVTAEPAPTPRPVEPVISSNPFDEPKKPSTSRSWIIGGSIAAVVFLCLCCCLPLVIAIVTMRGR